MLVGGISTSSCDPIFDVSFVRFSPTDPNKSTLIATTGPPGLHDVAPNRYPLVVKKCRVLNQDLRSFLEMLIESHTHTYFREDHEEGYKQHHCSHDFCSRSWYRF